MELAHEKYGVQDRVNDHVSAQLNREEHEKSQEQQQKKNDGEVNAPLDHQVALKGNRPPPWNASTWGEP